MVGGGATCGMGRSHCRTWQQGTLNGSLFGSGLGMARGGAQLTSGLIRRVIKSGALTRGGQGAAAERQGSGLEKKKGD